MLKSLLIALMFSTLPPSFSQEPIPAADIKSSSAPSTETPSPNTKATNKKAIDPMRDKMLMWSRQLGVSCVHCHNLENFKDGSNPNFQKAALHQQGVLVLQQDIFTERDNSQKLKVPVDCYMCHRGQTHPDFKEPPSLMNK